MVFRKKVVRIFCVRWVYVCTVLIGVVPIFCGFKVVTSDLTQSDVRHCTSVIRLTAIHSIKHLVPINNISRKAGDLAILESMNRMLTASSDTDVVFRIGGDEFALLTDSTDITYAEEIAEKIRSYNGETFRYEEQEIPLSLHVSITRFEGSPVKYNELFTNLHLAIKESK